MAVRTTQTILAVPRSQPIELHCYDRNDQSLDDWMGYGEIPPLKTMSSAQLHAALLPRGITIAVPLNTQGALHLKVPHAAILIWQVLTGPYALIWQVLAEPYALIWQLLAGTHTLIWQVLAEPYALIWQVPAEPMP